MKERWLHLKKQRAKTNYKRCIPSENRTLFIVNACFPPSFNDCFLNADDLCGWAEQMSFLIALEICFLFFFSTLSLSLSLSIYLSLSMYLSIYVSISCCLLLELVDLSQVCVCVSLGDCPCSTPFWCRPLHTVRGLPNSVIISPLHGKRMTRWMTYRSHSTADCNLLRLNWWSAKALKTEEESK